MSGINGINGGVAGGGAPKPSVSSKEKQDEVLAVLRTKEEEVKEMLAPEKEMREIDNLANKIVAEVKALETKGGTDGAENSEFTYLAAVESAPQFHCPTCGNRHQGNFMLDAKQGDTICLGADGGGCGTVVQDHKVHEGSMYRKFEGEADRSHHGPAPNRLYSTAHNMRTWISEGKDANRLRNLAEDVEMGLSNVGKEERKTRTAYKDQMKREAFDLVNHIAANCDLHETVVVRAKELFAGWRNVKEHVNQKHAVICACIVAAYRQVSTEELRRQFSLQESRRRGGKAFGEDHEDPLHPFVCPVCKAGFNALKALHAHRKEVHKRKQPSRVEPAVSTDHVHWSLPEAKNWLTGVVAKLELPAKHVDSICALLEKSLNAQDKDHRVGSKRKPSKSRTAGQYLMMLSLNRFIEVCGGGVEGRKAADRLHQEIGRKRAARDRQDKVKKANYNAAQRNHQNVRKPWVAHINAELNSQGAGDGGGQPPKATPPAAAPVAPTPVAAAPVTAAPMAAAPMVATDPSALLHVNSNIPTSAVAPSTSVVANGVANGVALGGNSTHSTVVSTLGNGFGGTVAPQMVAASASPLEVTQPGSVSTAAVSPVVSGVTDAETVPVVRVAEVRDGSTGLVSMAPSLACSAGMVMAPGAGATMANVGVLGATRGAATGLVAAHSTGTAVSNVGMAGVADGATGLVGVAPSMVSSAGMVAAPSAETTVSNVGVAGVTEQPPAYVGVAPSLMTSPGMMGSPSVGTAVSNVGATAGVTDQTQALVGVAPSLSTSVAMIGMPQTGPAVSNVGSAGIIDQGAAFVGVAPSLATSAGMVAMTSAGTGISGEAIMGVTDGTAGLTGVAPSLASSAGMVAMPPAGSGVIPAMTNLGVLPVAMAHQSGTMPAVTMAAAQQASAAVSAPVPMGRPLGAGAGSAAEPVEIDLVG